VTKCSREMTYLQKGLIDKVLRVTGMQDCNVKPIPAYTTPPLGNDAGGPRCQQSWNNASVLAMLMHLASNSMQDIQYTVYHCVRFTYEQAILRICTRYLKGTQGKGQVFKPKAELVLNYYVDAEFTGYWKDGNELDPVCVKSKSKTSYLLLPGGCPVTWISSLQTGIAQGTTEVEEIALSQAKRGLLPMKGILLKGLENILKLFHCNKSVVLSTVWEDHTGAIRLAEATSKTTFKTKHIAVQYHFFREHLHEEIQVKTVDTTNQLADLFTKELVAHQFQKLAARLMGWTYVGNDGISGEDSRKHSSGLETRQMRGSDAGDTSGQGLIAGSIIGLSLRSRQARSSPIQPVCQATWMVSIHGSWLVHGSVVGATAMVLVPSYR